MTKVRFAPSPTGYLHIGNFRTALINFLFAKNKNGHFMLRIDDTDDERSLQKYEDAIKKDLSWVGINWDSLEKQSSRLSYYDQALQKLLDKKRAYPCFETAEELSLKRKKQLSSGKPPIYDRSALNLSDSDIADFKAKGKSPHYRFLLDHTDVNWNDLVKGISRYNMSNLSDPVIIREDGRVIYTLASVVDDIDFGVTDILRGEDHMTNSAAQIQLFEALESLPPNLGHLSLLTDISGAGLSKRMGSISLRDLKDEGFQPMAISSLLSKIGTSDAVEIFRDINQIISDFDISKFGKSKPKFDKNDSSNVIIRGAKQINNWVVNINPSNVLQVNWSKEKSMPPKERTYEEAFEVIIGGVKKSLNEFWKNIPEDWKDDKPVSKPYQSILDQYPNIPIFDKESFKSWADNQFWQSKESHDNRWGPPSS